jgi:hypothetical protein
MAQCFKTWILSTVPVACKWLFLPQNMNMAAPTAGKDDVKRQGVWFGIFVCFRLFYSPEIIPRSLVFYLDNAHYCVCGSACFEMFIRRSDSLQLKRIANTLTFSENVGTTVQAETFYCSRKCVKLVTEAFEFWILLYTTTLLSELIRTLIPANEYVLNVWSCNVFVLLYKCFKISHSGTNKCSSKVVL